MLKQNFAPPPNILRKKSSITVFTVFFVWAHSLTQQVGPLIDSKNAYSWPYWPYNIIYTYIYIYMFGFCFASACKRIIFSSAAQLGVCMVACFFPIDPLRAHCESHFSLFLLFIFGSKFGTLRVLEWLIFGKGWQGSWRDWRLHVQSDKSVPTRPSAKP